MKFTTETGSIYEVNITNKQIRRLSGTRNATTRQGQDGEWKDYAYIFPDPIDVGKIVLIVWAHDTSILDETEDLDADPDYVMKTTMTSAVVKIEE
jgi:hypothetical protein